MKNKVGDKVSLQSLSGGMAGDEIFSHKYEIGKTRIKELGLNPVASPNSLKGSKFTSENPQKRAEDLMMAFKDKDTKLIIANIGGFDSHKLIPYLDPKTITENAKPIMGYSDITSLHLFLNSLGVQTYYGPAILDGFAENDNMHDVTLKSVKNVLFTDEKQKIVSSEEWTSEFLDWANPELDNVKREMYKEEYGHLWTGFKGQINGRLIGGCLDTIVQIKEEKFFPDLQEWMDKIIFLETSEQKMTPREFGKSLDCLSKEIEICKAVIFGKPKDEEYFDEYLEIAKSKINKPFVFNVNFGHTAPMYTIPYGGFIEMDIDNKIITISK